MFVALILLLSTPSMILAKSVSVIDTELRDAGENPQRVRTRMDFADPRELHKIPTEMGEWSLVRENAWDRVAEILDTNVLLSRDYGRRDLLQDVNLLVVRSGNVSSFHPAPVCYRVQGWTVPEDGDVVQVPVPNATWAADPWLSDAEPRVFNGSLDAKLLVVTREAASGGTEKRAALYVYLKDLDWRIASEVVWVRVEMTLAPSSDGRAEAQIMGGLLAGALPHLFDFEDGEELTLAEIALARFGALGAAAAVAFVAAPAAVAAWPILLRGWTRRGP